MKLAPYGTPTNPVRTGKVAQLIADLRSEGLIAQAQEMQGILSATIRNCGHHPERAPC